MKNKVFYEKCPEGLKGRDWLDYHLETFVRPRINKIPDVEPGATFIGSHTPTILDTLIAFWEEIKAKSAGREIVLPGRDAYHLEILARLDGYPTTFRPELSSVVSGQVNYSEKVKNFVGSYPEAFGADSGNLGTVIKRMGITRFLLANYAMSSDKSEHQALYGKDLQKNCYALYGQMEGSPKYWTSGNVTEDGDVIQDLSYSANFTNAAMLTRFIAEHYLKANLNEIRKTAAVPAPKPPDQPPLPTLNTIVKPLFESVTVSNFYYSPPSPKKKSKSS